MNTINTAGVIITVTVVFFSALFFWWKRLRSRKWFRANHVFTIMPYETHINNEGPIYFKFDGRSTATNHSACSFTLSDNCIELLICKESGMVSHTIPVSSILSIHDWNGYDRIHRSIYFLFFLSIYLGVCFLTKGSFYYDIESLFEYFCIFPSIYFFGIFPIQFLANRSVNRPCISIITNTGNSFCIAFCKTLFDKMKVTRADADRIIRIIERLVYASHQNQQTSLHQDPQPSHSPHYPTSNTNTPYSGSLNR